MAVWDKLGAEARRFQNRATRNPIGTALGVLTGGAYNPVIGAGLGGAAGGSIEEDLTAPVEPIPDLVDEESINEESKRILEEERARQKSAPGIRSQTVLTSQRGKRPSLLTE